MQKSIIVGANERGNDYLSKLLGDGWKVVKTEQFRPSDGASLGNYTPGNVLVIVEKE